jgi:hypothetical protein
MGRCQMMNLSSPHSLLKPRSSSIALKLQCSDTKGNEQSEARKIKKDSNMAAKCRCSGIWGGDDRRYGRLRLNLFVLCTIRNTCLGNFLLSIYHKPALPLKLQASQRSPLPTISLALVSVRFTGRCLRMHHHLLDYVALLLICLKGRVHEIANDAQSSCYYAGE